MEKSISCVTKYFIFLLAFYSIQILCSGKKLLEAAPFVVSNSALTVHSLYAVHTTCSNTQKMTKVEKAKCTILVAASLISAGYSIAIILDNLN